MNRDLFNKKKRMSEMNDNTDPDWAEDVSFSSLEKKIKDSKKATMFALRPLDEKETKRKKSRSFKESEINSVKQSNKSDSNTSGKKETANADKKFEIKLKKSRKRFLIFMISWSASLIIIISILLFGFYRFLKDYEKVYNESLPCHVMDDFMKDFTPLDVKSLYGELSEKPVISEFETEENVKNYYTKLIDEKNISYTEDRDFTDKNPVYLLTADNYVFGKVSMSQKEEKRAYDLPIYQIDDFEMYSEPEWNVTVQAYDNCKVFVNDVKVSPEYVSRIDLNPETHFEEFTTLPLKKYYKITGLYEQPEIKVINAFGEEISPKVNNTTGVYETPIIAPKEIEDEMIEFAKEAVSVYAQVVCREVNDSALDKIFTKNNMIVKEIKSNSGNLKYFPNHVTQEVEDEIIEFIPYSEEAFYCEIKHTQHMLIYGVRPRDVETDARFYYYKEDGSWKVCAMTF